MPRFAARQRPDADGERLLFRQQPWDWVTIAEVATEAGIGKCAVCKYFPSKEALFARLVLDMSQANLDELRAFEQMLADPILTQLCQHCDCPAFQERLEAPYREEFLQLEPDYVAFFGQLLRSTFGEQPSVPPIASTCCGA